MIDMILIVALAALIFAVPSARRSTNCRLCQFVGRLFHRPAGDSERH